MNDSTRLRQPGRREVLTLGVGLFVAALPRFTRPRAVVRRTVPVMGTIGELAVVHRDPRTAHRALDAAVEQLRATEWLMTRFDPRSDVGRANLTAFREAVAIAPETADVIAGALGWAERTGGAFDPCLGVPIELWDVGHRTSPPETGRVAPLASRHLYRALDVDRWRGRPAVRFTAPDVRLDLGGIAKGYGVDRAIQALREHGIRHGLVSVGGDLRALGTAADGTAWRIGIRSPRRADQLMATVPLEDAAIATSGTYLQYFTYRGRRYHHLLDPVTASPLAGTRESLTVRAADCMSADALATGLFAARDPGTDARRLGGEVLAMA